MSAAIGPAARKRTTAHLESYQWKPGQSGNPIGRRLGSRNKLSEDFLKALQADFEAHGVEAIEAVRTKRPQDYLKIIASLLPAKSELDVSIGPSPELKVALSEFAADYTAVRDAMQRIGVSPVMIEAVTIEEDE